MSRSGYGEGDCEYAGLWDGIIASATRGKRGQAFFRALVAALDALPEKRLIANELEMPEGSVCALGALGKARGVDMTDVDTYDRSTLGNMFDIAPALAAETMYVNDEWGPRDQTPEQRWQRVRDWAVQSIRVTPDELLPLTP